MNAELIDLYRGVQGRRGEWRPGDRYFDILHREHGVLCDFCDTNNDGNLCVSVDYLWLPPVWSEDGRCLVGILKDKTGGISVEWYGHRWTVWIPDIDSDDIGEEVSFVADTLPEALLRAIREQEGIA